MFYSNQIESSANIDNHPYPTNVYQKALFQEVCASATIPYTMAGRDVSQVPTGVNVTNRIVPTGMPSPNETRNVLITTTLPVRPDQLRGGLDTRLSRSSKARVEGQQETKSPRPVAKGSKQHPASMSTGRSVIRNPSSIPKRGKVKRISEGQSRSSNAAI